MRTIILSESRLEELLDKAFSVIVQTVKTKKK